MRLEEILQDFEMLPDGASMKFNDTRCIGYLLGALRHEPDWETVALSIISSQLKGELTFRQACNELRVRCETDRAYNIMDKAVKSKKKIPGLAVKLDQILDAESVETITTALVSSVSKRINQEEIGQNLIFLLRGARLRLITHCAPYTIIQLSLERHRQWS